MILLCAALVLMSCNAQKQAPVSQENVGESFVFSYPYVFPYYLNGGEQGLQSDFYSALAKTAPVTQECVKGRAVVSFAVSKDGNIDPNSIKLVRNKSVPEDYIKAAIEAIKGLGKFEPGKMDGQPKKVSLSLPVIYPVPLDRIRTSE